MAKELLRKFTNAIRSVLPIVIIVYALSPWIGFTVTELVVFGVSALFLILGMALFDMGAEMAMTPMGSKFFFRKMNFFTSKVYHTMLCVDFELSDFDSFC